MGTLSAYRVIRAVAMERTLGKKMGTQKKQIEFTQGDCFVAALLALTKRRKEGHSLLITLLDPELLPFSYSFPRICSEWRSGESFLVKQVIFARVILPAKPDSSRIFYHLTFNNNTIVIDLSSGRVE